MMIPVRCFTCGTVIASAWETYNSTMQAGGDVKKALDDSGLERFCCRRMLVSHRDLIKEAAHYE
ncbi:MAG: DNA-directed RNA polymerase subunit N [Thermoplasmatota archaeon]